MESKVSDKRIIIIAGPNGAGKTTFARSFLPVLHHSRRKLLPSKPDACCWKKLNTARSMAKTLLLRLRSRAKTICGISNNGERRAITSACIF